MSTLRLRTIHFLLSLFVLGVVLSSCAGRSNRVRAVSVRKNDKHIVISLPRPW
ncbi:MAG TPA: hypothetical protein VF646_16410 [Cytophagales bacterium]